MKRLLFFILMVAAILGTSYVVLFSVEFEGGIGKDIIDNLLADLFSGNMALGFETQDFVIYGLIAFCIINIAILFTMAVMFLMNFGMLGRIFKFYSTAGWFLVSSLIVTVTYGLFWYATEGRVDNINGDQFPIMVLAPIIASVVLFIMALIFKKGEKKKAL